MAARAIIRMGDPTSHGGTVLEGFPMLNVYGKPASGIGHKGHCPQCKRDFVIVAGAENLTFMGKNIAVEGMQTSCGAVLIATQHDATVDNTPGENVVLSSALSQGIMFGSGNNEPANFDQYLLLEDHQGNPLDGIPYRLTAPNGEVITGATGADGKTKVLVGKDGDKLNCAFAMEGV